MSNWIRRDLTQFVGNSQIDDTTSFGNMGELFKIEFIDWTNVNNVFLSNYTNIKNDIINKSASLFGVKNFNIQFFASYNEAIDSIFKVFLEMYENVVITLPSNSLYEKYAVMNHGRIVNVQLENDIEDEYKNIIEEVRQKNAKIVFIHTDKYKNNKSVSYEIVKEIAKNMPNLVVVDDSKNLIDNDTFSKLSIELSNVIVIKSFANTKDFTSVNGVFLLASKEVILDISSVLEEHFSRIEALITLFALNNFMADKPFKNAIDFLENSKKLKEEQERVLHDKNDDTIDIIEEPFQNDEYENISHVEDMLEQVVEENYEILEESAISDTFEETEVIDSPEPESPEENIEIKKNTQKVYDDRPLKLVPNNRQSLIEEVTKFPFISIFSSNQTHVYILSRTEVYSTLLEEGIILKKYNSSQGEILRLTIDRTNENERVLNIFEDISDRVKFFTSYD